MIFFINLNKTVILIEDYKFYSILSTLTFMIFNLMDLWNKLNAKENKIYFAGSVVLLYLFCIGIENTFREALFNLSCIIIKDNKQYITDTKTNFFEIITMFGTAAVIIPIICLVLNWCSIATSYTFIQNYVLAAYCDNLLKIIYRNPRPYWFNQDTHPIKCDGGYGNPSGHAYTSSAVYLAIWHLTSDNELFNKRIWLRKIYLFVILGFIFSIIYSRFYFGVHAINQLLYGFILGAIQYLFLFVAIKQHKLDFNVFFEIFTTTTFNIIYWTIYGCLFILLLLVYYLIQFDYSYENYLLSVCPYLKEFRKFGYDGMTNALNLFILLGAHTGIMILCLLIKRKYSESCVFESVNKFADTTFLKSCLRLLFIGLLAVPTMIPSLIISTDTDFTIYGVFKLSVPYFSTFCIIYSVGIYYSLVLNLGNIKSPDNTLVMATLENPQIK